MTERKKELLALLPSEVQKSKELTTSAKLILANIIQWYGTDYARENQSFYRTNKEMMKDTQIKSENSIISGALLLQQKGLISRESGERGKASTYILNVEAMKSYTANRPQNTNCSNSTNNGEVSQLMATIGEMKAEINSLKGIIEELKTAISLITSNQNCSTDIELEIDKDTDIPVYKSVSNEVLSDDEDIAVTASESDSKPNDILDSCPIDNWVENTDVEAWAEQYGNNTVYNTSNFKEWNAEITEAFRKLEADITMLFHSKTESESKKLQTKIEETFKWCNDNRDKFTEKQFKKVQVQCRRWQSVAYAKVKYFKNGKNKAMQQTVQKYNESPINPTLEQPHDSTENIIKPPAPISETNGNDALTANEVMAAYEHLGEDGNCTSFNYYSLNETTLKTEYMNDKERDYFRAEEGIFTDDGVLNRYINAHKWLRNPKDADRLYETYQEKASQIANGDCVLFEKYINRWNKYCEQVA